MNESPAPDIASRPSTSRQEQFVGRRQQILESARRLFARQGFHGTSIRDVHRDIGVSDGLLYHYFPSKLDMLQAVLAEGFDAINGRRLADIPDGTPVREALLRTGRELWARWLGNDDLMRILVREHRVLEEAGDYSLPSFFLRSSVGLGEFLERQMLAGEMRSMDPMLAARHFINAMLGLYLCQVMLGGDRVVHRDFEDVLQQTVDMMWVGLADMTIPGE